MIRKKLIVLIPLKKSYPVNKRNIDERCSIFCLYLLTCFMHFFRPPLPHFWQPSIFSNLFSASMSLVVTVVSKISYIKEINLVFVFLCLTCFTQHHALEVHLLSQMAIFHYFLLLVIFHCVCVYMCIYMCIYTHIHVYVYTHTHTHHFLSIHPVMHTQAVSICWLSYLML